MKMGSIILPAKAKQTATMIFLHGLGDSGASWAEILPSLVPPFVKLILPHAPVRPVTLNQGIRMPSWYDLRPAGQPQDSAGIKQASKEIQELIQKETEAGTPDSRIVLGGFSQGGGLALYSGLTGSTKLGAILALSTWLPLKSEIDWDNVHKPHILQCHGDQDKMISAEAATRTANLLQLHVPTFTFKMYPGLDHSIASEEEAKDIAAFLDKVLKGKEPNKL